MPRSRRQTTEQKPGAQQTTNSATQLYFCIKCLSIITLFLETHVQDKHEGFIKITVNYSVIVSCSAHFPPAGRNSGSTTDRVISNSRYNEACYSEAPLYLDIILRRCHFCKFVFKMSAVRPKYPAETTNFYRLPEVAEANAKTKNELVFRTSLLKTNSLFLHQFVFRSQI